ncbi:MAG: J domain-containing protein [Rhodanobacteraceae bacterium]|nr:J domain-containing protein [Rhodanobacteraceae bacterium]
MSKVYDLVLAMFRDPGLIAELRDRALPDDVGLVIRIAAGEAAALDNAVESTGESSEVMVEASVFFLQQILFAPTADPYRVLGVGADAAQELLRENYRWLMKWLHPDRNQDGWEAVYADRVNMAWQDLKTPERRAEYDRTAPVASGMLPVAVLGTRRVTPMKANHSGPLLSGSAVRRLPALVLGTLGIAAISVVGLTYWAQTQTERELSEMRRDRAQQSSSSATAVESDPLAEVAAAAVEAPTATATAAVDATADTHTPGAPAQVQAPAGVPAPGSAPAQAGADLPPPAAAVSALAVADTAAAGSPDKPVLPASTGRRSPEGWRGGCRSAARSSDSGDAVLARRGGRVFAANGGDARCIRNSTNGGRAGRRCGARHATATGAGADTRHPWQSRRPPATPVQPPAPVPAAARWWPRPIRRRRAPAPLPRSGWWRIPPAMPVKPPALSLHLRRRWPRRLRQRRSNRHPAPAPAPATAVVAAATAPATSVKPPAPAPASAASVVAAATAPATPIKPPQPAPAVAATAATAMPVRPEAPAPRPARVTTVAAAPTPPPAALVAAVPTAITEPPQPAPARDDAESLVREFAAAYAAGDLARFDRLFSGSDLRALGLGDMRSRFNSTEMRFLEIRQLNWQDDSQSMRARAMFKGHLRSARGASSGH